MPTGNASSTDGIGGPVNYDYSKYINSPGEMGMSSGSSMRTIGNNIGGIISYVKMLVNGGGPATKNIPNTNINIGPMGPKFFILTPTNCKDISDNLMKPRSLYLNYVPTGNIPSSFVVPDLPTMSSDFKGLLPGILTNIVSLNPVKMMNKIMTDTRNSCTLLKMDTVDASNNHKLGTGYVSLSDIRQMDPNWFSSTYPKPTIPTLEAEEAESFKTRGSNYNNNNNNNNNNNDDVFSSVSNVNFNNVNKLPPIYFNLLSLIGIYIMLEIMLGGRIH